MYPKLNNVVSVLLDEIPEYRPSSFVKEHSLGLPYIVFADFTEFILNLLSEEELRKEELSKVFDFINNQYSSNPDIDVKNIIYLEILQNLATHSEFNQKLKKYLKQDALRDFEKLSFENK